MAQRILGIDLGARAVKAVLIESTYRGFTVLDHGLALVAPGETPPALRQVEALAGLLTARGWRFAEAVVALPGVGATALVTLPFTDPRRIEQTVPFEVEGQIPFDLAQVAWDWQLLGTRDGKSDLLVGVVRREELSALLTALAPLGVDPRAVLPPGPAYAALLATAAAGPPAPPEPGADPGAEVVIDIGQERTSICLVSSGSCELARTFAFGASQIARGLARELSCSEPAAQALLAAEARGERLPQELEGLAKDPRAAQALLSALGVLTRELRATLRSWGARVGARRTLRTVLCGELGGLPGLPELLAAELDGPVGPLVLQGPSAEAGNPIPPGLAPTFALALSLALRGHQGSRAPRLNLRRGDLSYVRDFQHLKGRVEWMAAAFALLLLLAGISAGVKVFALARQEALLDRALCDAEQKLVGKCFGSFEEAQAVLRGRGAAEAVLPRASAVDLLAELSERVPMEVKVKLDKVDVTRDKLHLEGSTENAESVDRLVAGLKGSRCFTDARSGGARRRSDGKFEFSIDSGLTCLDSVARAPAGGRG